MKNVDVYKVWQGDVYVGGCKPMIISTITKSRGRYVLDSYCLHPIFKGEKYGSRIHIVEANIPEQFKDILEHEALFDEGLSAADNLFQLKCYEEFKEDLNRIHQISGIQFHHLDSSAIMKLSFRTRFNDEYGRIHLDTESEVLARDLGLALKLPKVSWVPLPM